MIIPMASQTTKRTRVTHGRLTIRTSEAIMERIGIHGTNGTRNARRRLGCVRHRINTAAETSTNAANVPMLVSSATTLIGVRPATNATTIPTSRLDREGVQKRGCMREKKPGRGHHGPLRRRCGSGRRAERSIPSSGHRLLPSIDYDRLQTITADLALLLGITLPQDAESKTLVIV